jgi:peptidoglycan biosynthesis protein MviN/MurJ (putative lipid II flippase)
MNLLRAAASVSAMTLASRITGFVRDTLIAVFFGAGAATDAFTVAFRIPNLLRRLFAEGAFSQAFVPILGEYKAKHGDEATRELAGKVLGVLRWCSSSSRRSACSRPPRSCGPPRRASRRTPTSSASRSTMLRICFPYILFVSLVSFAAGLLNTYGSFKAPAFAPVLLNVSFIALHRARCAALRAADHGARVGRVRGRHPAIALPAAVPEGRAHAAAAALGAARSRRDAHPEADGARGTGRRRSRRSASSSIRRSPRSSAMARWRGSTSPTG